MTLLEFTFGYDILLYLKILEIFCALLEMFCVENNIFEMFENLSPRLKELCRDLHAREVMGGLGGRWVGEMDIQGGLFYNMYYSDRRGSFCINKDKVSNQKIHIYTYDHKERCDWTSRTLTAHR